jgi:uncharacterized membrane protein YfcA
MDFLISGLHINIFYLIGIGFVIGVLGGFFGVGGSFLAGPALFAVGMPMNMVVGTDLAHIVGKSIVASTKHHSLGHVDIKLAWIMVIGTVIGTEVGAQSIQALKETGSVDVVVGSVMVVVLVGISAFVTWEGLRTMEMRSRKKKRDRKQDESAFGFVAAKIQSIRIWPNIHLPKADIHHSVWVIVIVSFVCGIFSGFLGGGAGYVRMPAMVYLLGIPTHIAVGTDLFEVMISAGYGTLTHGVKGNVDIMVALVMHTGAAIGAQIGAAGTERYSGPRIRLAFVPLPLIGAAVIVYKLLSGQAVSK